VDTQTGRVVSRSRLEGQFRDSSPTHEGAAVLVARPNRIGPARLGVVRTDGVVHWVTVSRIRVGFRPKPSAARGQLVEPGLAVDPAGGRVFLVPAAGAAAEIRLADLRVGYHTLRRGGLRRLAAAEKEFRGPWRDAQYLGGGLIAVSGYNGVRRAGQFRFAPAGLMLLDTRDWSERMLDRTSTWFTFGTPLLLVIHPPNLIAYSAQGQLRFQLKIDRPLGIVATIGVYAYVWQSDNRVDVVDLASGTLVRTTAPTSLTPIALVPD
jgi:hypothetical protein